VGGELGVVPMTDAEIDFMADRLKPLLLEGLTWLAETPTEPVDSSWRCRIIIFRSSR